ncbi:MAG: fasciclin domain-containing protein [Bacteroidaceae bacterium]|nr:fasciclin domain-containing protein [Bacteroidaceae bacterium]
MKHIKFRHFAIAAAAILALGSCREEIGDEARYTFTGHTVASFLEENPEVYSSFIHILDKGGRLNLMKSYGQYTCFAPTNDAIAKYLYEQDSIYWTSVEANKADPKVKVRWTGVTSPELSELSDSMCKVLSQTHLIPEIYLTTDMEGDIIPVMNMNDRYLSLSYDVDENNLNILLINGNGKIIGKDEEVQNGVVHTIAAVLNPSTNTVPAQIEAHDYFSIITEAIEMTGYADQMQLYKDESYADGDLKAPSIYNTQQVPYPANKYYGYTAFLEPNEVYNEAGIYNFNDLVAKCKEWYPEADASAPLTSKNNPVNQFVGYHLLDRKLPYSRLVHYKINPHSNYNSEKDLLNYSDRNEFYETMAGKIIKITMPRSQASLQTTILLNYSRDKDPLADPYMNAIVYKAEDFIAKDSTYANFKAEALNGTIHAIDKLLIYNEDVMAGRVLNMIIRFDASSICSELQNNSIRNTYFTHTSDGEVFIPHDYCKNLKVYTDETRHYYLSPHTGWCNYQGDEMMTLGAFDFAYKLPPVPAGTYEIRMGYSANDKRHVVQFYIDNEVAGIPVDLRIRMKDPRIGFLADTDTEDNGIQNDKEMKNRGYLKGSTQMRGYNENDIARDLENFVRKVITTKYLSDGEHWIRFKNVNENDDGSAQFMHDYFELVPMNYLRDESLSLEEKRK